MEKKIVKINNFSIISSNNNLHLNLDHLQKLQLPRKFSWYINSNHLHYKKNEYNFIVFQQKQTFIINCEKLK